MDSLSSLSVFVQVAETRSFTAAGRVLGVSSSAVGKSIARMEERLGVRLFHRSTRSITLTSEGALFLERSRRILAEVEAAEQELTQAGAIPRGKLRISVPQVRGLLMPVLSDFMRAYPAIELDVDFSDRMVDVIEEGFDAVIRTGKPEDSRLMARHLGYYQLVLVGTPGYFDQHGTPQQPQDLSRHACLRHKFCATGKLENWPLRQVPGIAEPTLRAPLVSTTIESLNHVVLEGLGIACLPDYMVNQAVEQGRLQRVLDDYLEHRGSFWMLWPSSRHASAKLRVFIDHMCAGLFPVGTDV
ncbi:MULTISPECIES: LysR family transcriptional regulator [Pseudomonas]|uniref:LysR family transcriptional regulator n=1 Tax=Pseudomonas gorinensis TaxID=3240790 RepID=A0ACA7P9J5_9PSED|nr:MULTISPECIES: LysR family transcriptional regulator [unclassified Pseudomonas]AHC36636.1 LysR family transcriptional regulator [Pseudomonas sp. TKP]MBL1312006.1 LysR family transcriptional regulator [Pseudomonas sp.]PMX05715.1 LysR family transcriptional regulator [Pseudomonas sp. MPBC4-3]PMX48608.1 LysR family transcriptional regulator [Pseudomonas sp. FW301-21B01]PMY08259.1 LysR family transcriptional regulator [Pseudomonas sp. MPR-R5A]